eukprot:5122156-Amphidinium_carterae.1
MVQFGKNLPGRRPKRCPACTTEVEFRDLLNLTSRSSLSLYVVTLLVLLSELNVDVDIIRLAPGNGGGNFHTKLPLSACWKLPTKPSKGSTNHPMSSCS